MTESENTGIQNEQKAEANTNAGKKYSSSAKERELYHTYLSEIEDNIKDMITLFTTGDVQSDKFGSLTLVELSEVKRVLVAIYSHVTLLWGRARSCAEKSELERKYRETAMYGYAKNYLTNASKEDVSKEDASKTSKRSSVTQKEIESKVACENIDYYKEEMQWGQIYSRLGACKTILEKQLDAVDSIHFMKKSEMQGYKGS